MLRRVTWNQGPKASARAGGCLAFDWWLRGWAVVFLPCPILEPISKWLKLTALCEGIPLEAQPIGGRGGGRARSTQPCVRRGRKSYVRQPVSANGGCKMAFHSRITHSVRNSGHGIHLERMARANGTKPSSTHEPRQWLMLHVSSHPKRMHTKGGFLAP